MQRRSFMNAALVGAVGVTVSSSLPAPAIAQGRRELKMVTTWPKNFPGVGTGAARIGKRITDATEGRLTVKVFGGGELVPPFESFDAVSTGAADMYHAAEYYWQGKHKAFNFFTTVPFGLTANEFNAWLLHAGGQQLWDELSAQFNLKPFAAGNTGVQMGGWFRKEINSAEDLKGLKIRMPGLGGECLRRVGAAAINLPGGEIYQALQSGTIDATEWVGPWNDLAFGFYKVAQYYYYPGFHEPGSCLSAAINLDVWNSLTPAEQVIVENACLAENNFMLAEFNAHNTHALETLVDRHRVELKQFPEDVLEAISAAASEVVRETGSVDGLALRVFESFMKFREQALNWTRLSETAYTRARESGVGF